MTDFLSVTESAGEFVSQEQVERICNRYYWAGRYCAGKDVLEVACGTGQGLGYLSKLSKSLTAGDYSGEVLSITRSYYDDRINLKQFDAQQMPFYDDSADVIIFFEAIYYLPSVKRFLSECRRILRNGGHVLVATANKDLYDFNPSPYSYNYYGVTELCRMFSEFGFSTEFFGIMPVSEISLRQRALRPIKKVAVKLNAIPKTMRFKKFFKRIVFGKLVTMPAEIKWGMVPYAEPVKISPDFPDKLHKVIYCAATLKKVDL